LNGFPAEDLLSKMVCVILAAGSPHALLSLKDTTQRGALFKCPFIIQKSKYGDANPL